MEGRNMMEGVRFRGDTPGERKSVYKRKKESRTQPGCRGSGGSLAFLKCTGIQQVCATLGAAACQAPPSMGFSRQEDWSGLPCPPPGDLPNPGMEPASLTSPALAGGFFTTSDTSGIPSSCRAPAWGACLGLYSPSKQGLINGLLWMDWSPEATVAPLEHLSILLFLTSFLQLRTKNELRCPGIFTETVVEVLVRFLIVLKHLRFFLFFSSTSAWFEEAYQAYQVKAMIFPVVMYRCQNWTIKKAER